MIQRFRITASAIVFLWSVLLLLPSAHAANFNVATEDQLDNAILSVNTQGAGTHTINITADITLTGNTTPIENFTAGVIIIINGGGFTVDANNTGRPFEIAASTTVEMNDITITGGNVAGDGGGIDNSGTLTLNNTTVSGNTAANGGGILNSGTLTLNNATVSENAAAGGGILNFGTLTLNNTTVSGNSATNSNSAGGGIFNSGALTLINTTVSGNDATALPGTGGGGNGGFGGGIFNTGGGTLTLINATVSGNEAVNVGGISNSDGSGSTTTITNTIVAGNTAANFGGNCNGTFTDNGNNLDDDGTCGFTDLDSKSDVADALLGPLADNGGPTFTHALLPGSPAIDMGDDAVCAADPVNGADQRGVARPQGAQCDIGAFELEAANPDHYLGYSVQSARRAARFQSLKATLRDFFDEAGTEFQVSAPDRLLNPADKNGEGIEDEETHLLSYPISVPGAGGRRRRGKAPAVLTYTDLPLENQFGGIRLDVLSPVSLLVPSGKSHYGYAEAPDEADHNANHFKCYSVALADGQSFEAREVHVKDQFNGEGKNYTLEKPVKLCAPAEKEVYGEITEVKDPNNFLTCYAVRQERERSRFLGGLFSLFGLGNRPLVSGLHVNNQFGPLELDAMAEKELCVPTDVLVKTWLRTHTEVRDNVDPPCDYTVSGSPCTEATNKKLPRVMWSEELAASANTFVETCSTSINQDLPEGVGENGYLSFNHDPAITDNEIIEAAVTRWAEGVDGYNAETGVCASSVCQYYKQMLPPNLEVGCAIKRGCFGPGHPNENLIIVACQYSPSSPAGPAYPPLLP